LGPGRNNCLSVNKISCRAAAAMKVVFTCTVAPRFHANCWSAQALCLTAQAPCHGLAVCGGMGGGHTGIDKKMTFQH
jgi:hypothetical protein